MLKAGTKANVHPSVAECVVDGRTLPGQTRADFLREVQAVVGEDIELDVFQEQPAVVMPDDTPLFDEIAAALSELEPGAKVIPYLIPGFTDAWAFSKLGCTFYGFVPVKLPKDGPAFAELFHAHDERIPVAGFLWGLKALYRVVKGFCAAG
jgi:acetylornithine deacetylase/succinyl-diaminopimelate desuccinylase-like protein